MVCIWLLLIRNGLLSEKCVHQWLGEGIVVVVGGVESCKISLDNNLDIWGYCLFKFWKTNHMLGDENGGDTFSGALCGSVATGGQVAPPDWWISHSVPKIHSDWFWSVRNVLLRLFRLWFQFLCIKLMWNLGWLRYLYTICWMFCYMDKYVGQCAGRTSQFIINLWTLSFITMLTNYMFALVVLLQSYTTRMERLGVVCMCVCVLMCVHVNVLCCYVLSCQLLYKVKIQLQPEQISENGVRICSIWYIWWLCVCVLNVSKLSQHTYIYICIYYVLWNQMFFHCVFVCGVRPEMPFNVCW